MRFAWLMLALAACDDFRPLPEKTPDGAWIEIPPPPHAPEERCMVWTRFENDHNANFGGPVCRPKTTR